MATALFISTADIKKNTILNGNVDEDKFLHVIKISQEIHIQNYLGTKLYDRLQAGMIAADLTPDEDTLLDDYIKDALIHWSMAEYLPFAPYQVQDGGVFRHFSENSNNTDKEEIDSLVQKERDWAEYFTKRMVDYLCANESLYPEFSTNVENDIRPDKTVNYTGGWYLD